MAATTDHFFSSDNLINIARQVSINAIIAVGMSCAILSGGIDLSVGSVMALTGTLTAGLMVAGVPPGLAIMAGLAVGIAFGVGNGFFIAYAKMPPIIVTLATMGIARAWPCCTRAAIRSTTCPTGSSSSAAAMCWACRRRSW